MGKLKEENKAKKKETQHSEEEQKLEHTEHLE